MPTFCYVLGSASGPFPSMVYLSASALRRLYPSERVVLVSDSATLAELRQGFPRLREIADFLAAPIRSTHPLGRSRELKLGLRDLLEGDLVYLDADTLALRRFDELFAPGPAFAGVLDRNRQHRRPQFPDWVRPAFAQMGWRAPLPRYFNSGVLFLPDAPQTRALAAEWRLRFTRLRQELGIEYDQPSLNSSLDALRIQVRTLPVEFNAMVQAWPYAARRARILHFFADGGQPASDSLLAHLLLHLERSGSIDWDAVDRARANGDAWTRPGPDIHRALATRRYARAARIALSRAAIRAGFDPVKAIGPRVFVVDAAPTASFIVRRLRKARVPCTKDGFCEPFTNPCVLRSTAAAGRLAARGVRQAVFVFSTPLDAYLQYARREQKHRVEALGGAEAPAAQEFFASRWRAAAREYLDCKRAGLAPVLIRQERAWEDARSSGDRVLRALFERFEPQRAALALSLESQQRLNGLLQEEQTLIEREAAASH
jgi:hypothetical protein